MDGRAAVMLSESDRIPVGLSSWTVSNLLPTLPRAGNLCSTAGPSASSSSCMVSIAEAGFDVECVIGADDCGSGARVPVALSRGIDGGDVSLLAEAPGPVDRPDLRGSSESGLN